ncbi:MAG TPA: SUMF1/EgtB/PvdO family nonheme iron enzyme [Kofleriaceae bacterium]|nr:SUMF1/EgtB/PvdO family nonheme iron enzyme [Kofleriaceae bacterium]
MDSADSDSTDSTDSTDRPDLDLFVVFAEPDAGFVRDGLLPALELPRDRVLLVDELPIGGLVVEEIDRGVSRSRYTIAVLSPAYLRDRWAQFGAQLALHAGRDDARVLPLRLADCELPTRIDARVALDFRDRARWAWELARLRAVLGRPTPDGAAVPYPDRWRQRRRRRARLGAAVAAVAAVVAIATLLAIAAVTEFRPRPDESSVAATALSPPPPPPPPPGMARIGAASLGPGVDRAAAVPAECRGAIADDGCRGGGPAAGGAPSAVAAFYLDRREVTNGEYADWLNATAGAWQLTPHAIVATRTEPSIPLVRTEKCGDGLTISAEGRARVTPESARWPVVCVTWSGADEYCRVRGKRLPLEAEWELAAVGAEGRPFPWGSAPPRQDVVAFGLRGTAAAHPRDAGGSPQDVSPDGVADLGGNVAEWIEDSRGDASLRTLRGGGFGGRTACDVLGARCVRLDGSSWKLDAGFRCARSAMEERGQR